MKRQSDAPVNASCPDGTSMSSSAENAASSLSGQSALRGLPSDDLMCPIDADAISVRWMHPYIPVPGQASKTYPPATMGFMQRVLRCYASGVVRGHGIPPFVHAAQLESLGCASSLARPALTTCLRTVRIADGVTPGGDDAHSVAVVLTREMDALYERHERHERHERQQGDRSDGQDKKNEPGAAYDDTSRLSAFQAYLIYILVLVFLVDPGGSRTRPFLRHAVMALQRMASASARDGLVCVAEQQQKKPPWAAWVTAEVKRRTLFTLYLADSALAAQDGLPTFMGTELRGLLAPAGAALWSASTLAQWDAANTVHANDWFADGRGPLHIDELWPPPADLDAAGTTRRNSRIDRWLEGVDAFGTMMYAVTSHTHGP